MGGLKEKIFKGVFVLSGSNIIMRVISFFTVILVTRFLSVRDYGIFVLFMSLTGPFNTFSGLGMDELVTVDAARKFGEGKFTDGRKILMNFFKLRLMLLICLLSLGWLLHDFFSSRYSIAFSQFYGYLTVLAIFQYFRNSFGIIFQATEKFSLIAKLNIVEIIVRTIIIVGIIVTIGLALPWLIISHIATTIITVFIFGTLAWRTIRSLPKDQATNNEKYRFSSLFVHGKWQICTNIVSSLMSSVSYWLIRAVVSTEAVALFSLAQSMFSALASLFPFKVIMLPIIARYASNTKLVAVLMERTVKYALLLFGLIIISASIVALPIISIFFPRYIEATPIFRILVFKLLFNVFSFSQVPFFFARQEQRFLFNVELLDTLLVVAMAPILMREFGVVGFVYESLITLIIINIVRERYMYKKHAVRSIDIKGLFRIDEYDRLLAREVLGRLKSLLKTKNGANQSQTNS